MSKKKKQSKEDKPTFASAYKDIKGFGNLPEPDKKKVKMAKFLKVLGKGK